MARGDNYGRCRSRPLQRLGRLLLGRNVLRRPVDRIEAAVIICLVAAFLTAAVSAACLAGHIWRSQRAAAARLRPTMTVLSPPGQAAFSQVPGARAEATAGLWLHRPGKPQAFRPSPGDMTFTALLVGIIPTGGATVVLILCYRLCRMLLDRHRLARWESAWNATGPRWTTRR
jgi:hypothetical protein